MEHYEYKLPVKHPLEKEIHDKLKELEALLQQTPKHKEIMQHEDFWAILMVSLLDLSNSCRDFVKPKNPPFQKKLILPK